MDYYREPEYEPEPQVNLPEDQKVTVGLSINLGVIEQAIAAEINKLIVPKLSWMINKKINDEFKNLLSKEYWSSNKIEKYLQIAVEKRLNEMYPEVVENKVNEFAEALKKLKIENYKNKDDGKTIYQMAKDRVETYINTELADSVSKSKEYIEQFAKNYFAQNLFRAMGMMDKLLPQTESIESKQ